MNARGVVRVVPPVDAFEASFSFANPNQTQVSTSGLTASGLRVPFQLKGCPSCVVLERGP